MAQSPAKKIQDRHPTDSFVPIITLAQDPPHSTAPGLTPAVPPPCPGAHRRRADSTSAPLRHTPPTASSIGPVTLPPAPARFKAESAALHLASTLYRKPNTTVSPTPLTDAAPPPEGAPSSRRTVSAPPPPEGALALPTDEFPTRHHMGPLRRRWISAQPQVDLRAFA
jgi:hypothetical protein